MLDARDAAEYEDVHMASYLDGDMQSLASRPDLVLHTERITASTLTGQLSKSVAPAALDVRAAGE